MNRTERRLAKELSSLKTALTGPVVLTVLIDGETVEIVRVERMNSIRELPREANQQQADYIG